ncbi:hypothetical protein SLEP1_g35108 [Rubroshorea leprosula]|uniref:Disease resistance protein At4g27190-like leucine-rich repeats domain-containing protein n=1 Tax=Rubroshorea leprosula TaxID=152421 RepID=A0AAV5KM57_9ROSI|nr:hypothetical protein SLEP1_g35108 [Rubroshorea leprosula]
MVDNTIWYNSMTSCIETSCIKKLTKLIIHGCDNLEYLFPSSIAIGLLKLRHLQVKKCQRMREIVVANGDEENENLIFPQLTFLVIEDLQNLVSFYVGNCIVEFSSLKQLRISNCISFERFITSFASANVRYNAPLGPLAFKEKVVFSNLEELQLSSIIIVNIIWNNLMTSGFKNLTKLIIHGCDNLEYLFSSFMVTDLLKLRHLQVKKCQRMSKIIVANAKVEEQMLIFPQLTFLVLEDLQNLISFNAGNYTTVEFSSLKQLRILNCINFEGFIKFFPCTNVTYDTPSFFWKKIGFSSNLEELQLCSIGNIDTIWHTSMISCFEKLKKLIIHDCKNLKYLFSSSVASDSEGMIQLLLPKLKRLELGDLPQLKSICWERAAMVCDSLEWIIIRNCYSLRRFPLYLPQLENGQPSPPPSLKQIVVWPQEWWKSLKWDHPNAERVLLQFCERYHSFPSKLVEGRIKRLELTDIDVENTWVPPSVQELFLNGCNYLRSLNDISSTKYAEELKCCRIRDCNGVKFVFSSSINLLAQKLEALDLFSLENLEALFEAEAITKSPLPPDTFSSLKTISVWHCNKIKTLFPFWMNLQSLEEIHIGCCDQMEEIIVWDAEEAGGEKEGVILPKLESLKLKELPALKSICSRRAVMVCDSVEEIQIENCQGLRRIPLYLPLLDDGQPSPPPFLKQINVLPQKWGESWWESLEWDHPDAKAVLLRFRNFDW